MRRLFFLLLSPAALFVTLSVGVPRDASAHGMIDQVNEVETSDRQILSHAPVGQEFKPTRANLVAVDVNIASMNPQDGDDTLTLRVRNATIGGTVLAMTSASVDKNFDGWKHFDVSATLVPSQTYVIELEATKATHGWRMDDTNNPYASGSGFVWGNVNANQDWTFRTYATQPPVVGSVGGIVEIRADTGASGSESEPSAGGDQAKVAALAAVGGGLTFLAAGSWFIRRRLLH